MEKSGNEGVGSDIRDTSDIRRRICPVVQSLGLGFWGVEVVSWVFKPAKVITALLLGGRWRGGGSR